MMRKFIWIGIVLGLAPLCMGSACGGYQGWPGLTTQGGDDKVTEEVSVSDPGQLDNGLFTYYVNYNNLNFPGMKTVTTFRDGTAPPGTFTSDGNLEQHFNDHVGVLIAQANDRNGDGQICWIGCGFGAGDYTIPDAFCPAIGGTGSAASSSGFQAYCDKGLWLTIVASSFFEESKQSTTGSKFANAKGPGGSNFTPITIGQILASSQLLKDGSGGIVVTVNGLSLPNGASYSLPSPAGINAYGFGHAIAIDATQPGLKQAAAWLAGQWKGQPDGSAHVTLSLNGGLASFSGTVASGNTAALALQSYAGR
jgi:hypothetical protein